MTSTPPCWRSRRRLLGTFRFAVPEVLPALAVSTKLANQCHLDCPWCSWPHSVPQAAGASVQNDPTTRDRLNGFLKCLPRWWLGALPISSGIIGGGVWQSQGKFLRKRKEETNICGSLSLEEENEEGNGRWRGRGEGIEVACLWCCGLWEGSGEKEHSRCEHLCWCHWVAVKRGQSLTYK